MAQRLLVCALLGATLASVAAACDSPRVVDCDPGRFVRAGDDSSWCIFSESDSTSCPRLLPEAHALPWGGRGCASETRDPLPEDLCQAAGACAEPGDGG